jgi:hypothetical protein
MSRGSQRSPRRKPGDAASRSSRRRGLRLSLTLLCLLPLAPRPARAEPPPGPRAWPDRIAAVSAAEFWKQVEEGGLLPKKKFDSFFRVLPADAGGDAKGRDAAIAVLDTALALGDLRDGPHVELLDYEGTHVLGEPQIHSVQAFRNTKFDAWFLRSKTFSGVWEQWALVQDKTVAPNVAYYFHYRDGKPSRVHEQSDCYRCHSNGPRGLHPGRLDLVSGADYLDEVNGYCAEQVKVQTDFGGPRPDFGPELAVRECIDCHSSGADRGPLHRVQAHSIRTMISRGIMPPDGKLSREGGLELERWLKGE